MELAAAGPARGIGFEWRASFYALRITAEHQQVTPSRPTMRSSPRTAEAARIEIALPDGTCIRVGDDVCLAALRRVVSALRR